jgi:hypothetical protein
MMPGSTVSKRQFVGFVLLFVIPCAIIIGLFVLDGIRAAH